jgi:selenocysteine-specific elongation factor
MIVGTAGHIDHGKSTLVRALTGVDPDRLPEEKRRGITLDLGFAFLDAPGGRRIGFVDVPGHERLVHTMLAGATGVDYALLVVAADDGVMPQTREHLAVLSLLGIDRGIVVVTKSDRVDGARLDAVTVEIEGLLAGTSLAGAPVAVVSARDGSGIEDLKSRLQDEAARATRVVDEEAAFRLAVDRVFTLEGVGVVVTGSVHAGRVVVGDRLARVPGDDEVRVRSIHAQNRSVAAAVAGERCALGVVGLDRDRIGRGDWFVAPAAALATERVDARLLLWPRESRSLRAGTRVLVHIGAASVAASVAPLDGESLAAGEEARVQLVLHRPVGAWRGDRVVLRDASASRTIAGGRVLDPFAPARYRRTPQRLAELHALDAADPAARRLALLAVSPHGVDLSRFAAAEGRKMAPPQAQGLLVAEGWALAAGHFDAARARVVAALAEYHGRHPDELGPDAARLRRLALPRLADPAWRALLAVLVAAGTVALSGAWVHLPAHGERLSDADRRIAEQSGPVLAAAGFDGAWVRDIARETGVAEPLLRVSLARMARRGDLHQVVKDLYYPRSTVDRLAALCRELAARGEGAAAGAVTAAAFRDATGLGRKRAIQILEYFDRVGLLRRVGDVHRLRADSRLFEGVGRG